MAVTLSSPHAHGKNRTSRIMMTLVLATLPGLAAQTFLFGYGNLINTLIAILTAWGTEAVILKMRRYPISFFLKDNTALVTAVLLGLALPPFTPWWVTFIAVAFAISFAKHMYGGLGNNPFNPAMVGYALVLVSFPVQMTTTWALSSQVSGIDTLGISETLKVIFSGSQGLIDGYSGATPLDFYKHQIEQSSPEAVMASSTFNGLLNGGWEWVNLAFLAGGLFLLFKKVISWHIPVSLLVSLALCALIFGWTADNTAPFTLHMLSGATMLGAFFIATDPVSASTTPLGKLIYGAGIGIFTYLIRTWGAYPDAIAFAVLLMNFAAPMIDAYTQPRTYGHKRARRGLTRKDES